MHAQTLNKNLTSGMTKGNRLLMQSPTPMLPLQRSRRRNRKIENKESEDPKEEERLFHSHMWVKGSLLQFVIENGSQKNLISVDIVKRLGLLTKTHPQLYTIGWLHQGRYLRVSNATFPTTSSPSQMRYYVTLLLLTFVMCY